MNEATIEDDGPPLKKWALKGAVAGGVIGTLLGLVQLIIGKAIIGNPWAHENGFMFGLITIVLSTSSIYFAYRASKEKSLDMDRKLGWLVGLFIPSVLCFFLMGILWTLPGILLFGSALLLLKVMLYELNEAGVDHTTRVPKYKRRIVVISALFIVAPVFFGSFVPRMELGEFHEGDDDYVIKPMDQVVRLEDGEIITSSNLTGVLLVYVILLLGGLISAIYGQIGARTITIAVGVAIALALLFSFIFIPNILFIEGARMNQFDSDHFSSISGGWYMAMFGAILLVASQFIKFKTDKDKSIE